MVIKSVSGGWLNITDEDGGLVNITTEYFRFTDVSSYISCDDVTISGSDFVDLHTRLDSSSGYISLSAPDYIALEAKNITISGSLTKGSCTYSLPDKSGTIALAQDIPHLDTDSSSYVNIQRVKVGYGDPIAFSLQDVSYIKIIPVETNIEADDASEYKLHISVDNNKPIEDVNSISIGPISSIEGLLTSVEFCFNNFSSSKGFWFAKYATISGTDYNTKLWHHANSYTPPRNLYLELQCKAYSEYVDLYIITIRE